jgi:hypothetical protein
MDNGDKTGVGVNVHAAKAMGVSDVLIAENTIDGFAHCLQFASCLGEIKEACTRDNICTNWGLAEIHITGKFPLELDQR